MAITVHCPNPSCRHVFDRVSEEKVGRTGKCPKCGDRFTIRPADPTADTLQTKLPSSEATPSNQIGRYLIRSKLGSGAFGTVYRAYDPQLDRDVAVKVPHPGALESPKAVERFLREARTAAQLRHPHIVPVHDAGHDGTHYYIASAFIPGETLAHAIESGRRPNLLASAKIIADLADALAYAHSLGIVHRDIKPANVILDDRGNALLTDFGLAHRHDDSGASLTAAGAVLGTPSYMAPEQAAGRGQDVLPASDQYALGVMLYELLCGERPFKGPTHAILYQAIHDEPKSPSSIDSGVPRPLEAVCLKTMSKGPGDRHESCEVLAAVLREWRDEQRRRDAEQRPAAPTPVVPDPIVPGVALDSGLLDSLGATGFASAGSKRGTGNASGTQTKGQLPNREVHPIVPTPTPAPTTPDQAEIPKGWTPRKVAGLLLVLCLVPALLVAWSLRPPAPDPSSIAVRPNQPPVIVDVPPLNPAPPAPVATATKEIPTPPAEQAKRADPAPSVAVVEPDSPITNTIGMKLALIPAWTFGMGSDDSGQDDEKPKHKVRITKAFYLGTTEVTVGQFRRFVEASGYRTEAETDGKGSYGLDESTGKYTMDAKYTWKSPGFTQTDDHPVVLVSWNDAVAFCDWLGKQERHQYRLPTEAEWEYACRAGTTTKYANGDDPELVTSVGNVADGTAKAKFPGWTTTDSKDGFVFTAPVGHFPANKFGLHDMHGNAWEWCSDGYDSAYYAKSPTDDPPGIPGAPFRVNRGGGFSFTPGSARSADRSWYAPGSRNDILGFRVARVQSGH